MQENVHIHYSLYYEHGSPQRTNNPFQETRSHTFYRQMSPQRLQSQRMLQSPCLESMHITQSFMHSPLRLPHRQLSPSRRETFYQPQSSYRQERRNSPHRRESPQRGNSPHQRERPYRRGNEQRHDWNPFQSDRNPFRSDRSPIRSDRNPFQTYRNPFRSDRNPFWRDCHRQLSLTPVRSLHSSTPTRSLRSLTPVRSLRSLTPVRILRSLTPVRSLRSLTPVRRLRSLTPVPRVRTLRSLTPRRLSQSQQQYPNQREWSISRREYSPPRRNFSRQQRWLVRRPYKKQQLYAYTKKIRKLRILRKNASRALLQSLNGEIRSLTKLSRAVRGLPLNRKKYKKKIRKCPAVRCVQTKDEDNDKNDNDILNEPDYIQFID